MAITAHTGITLIEQAQAQKEVTANEAFARIDALLNCGALQAGMNTPPSTPTAGDMYILGNSPTGVWAGKAKQIAYFDQIWRFIAPRAGSLLWVRDVAALYVYDGAAWRATTAVVA
jgi:hypothetical protein